SSSARTSPGTTKSLSSTNITFCLLLTKAIKNHSVYTTYFFKTSKLNIYASSPVLETGVNN
ncbi:MAG: hypothetical protein ACXVHO_06750, partial [Methanobacterium sp.]